MAQRRCPGCGAPYNGKKCRDCLYTPFTAAEYRTHYEEIRPAPVRQAIPVKSRRRPARTRKRRLGCFGIIAAVIFLNVVLGILSAAFDAISHTLAEEPWIQPEPVAMPEDALVLYEDQELLVALDWDGTGTIAEDLRVYVQNTGDTDMVVCTDGVAINGCMTGGAFFYCEAAAEAVSMGTLWLDEYELENLGIREAANMEMYIDIYASRDYEMVADDYHAAFSAVHGDGVIQELDASGRVVYDQDGILLVFQGWATDTEGDTLLRFYAENNTGSFLELFSSELLVDGQGTGNYLWQNFFPGTRAVVDVWLYDEKISGSAESLQFDLGITLDKGWDTVTDLLTIPLN